jgi:hypothetical protein
VKKYIIFSIALVIISLTTACHKHDGANSAEITIMEPMLNDTILNGAEIHIEGTISGDGELHGYALKVSNATTDSVYFSMSSNSHASSYSFHEHWLNNLSDTTTVKVTVEADLNDEGAKSSKSVNVVCLP